MYTNLPPVRLLPRKVQPAAKAFNEAVARARAISAQLAEVDNDRARAAAKAADDELHRNTKPEDIGKVGTPHQDARAKEAATLKQADAEQAPLLLAAERTLGAVLVEQKVEIAASADKAPADSSVALIALIEAYCAGRADFEEALNYRAWVADISESNLVPHFGEVDEQTSYSAEIFGGSTPSAKEIRAKLILDAMRHEDLRKREALKAAFEERNARAREVNEGPHRGKQAADNAENQARAVAAQEKHAEMLRQAEQPTVGVYVKLDGTVVDL